MLLGTISHFMLKKSFFKCQNWHFGKKNTIKPCGFFQYQKHKNSYQKSRLEICLYSHCFLRRQKPPEFIYKKNKNIYSKHSRKRIWAIWIRSDKMSRIKNRFLATKKSLGITYQIKKWKITCWNKQSQLLVNSSNVQKIYYFKCQTNQSLSIFDVVNTKTKFLKFLSIPKTQNENKNAL